MEATALDDGQIYQASHDQFIFNLPPLPSPARQIVEGYIPQQPRAFQKRADLLERLHRRGGAVVNAVTSTPGVEKSLLAASYAGACQRAGWPVIAWITRQAQRPGHHRTGGLARRLSCCPPRMTHNRGGQGTGLADGR